MSKGYSLSDVVTFERYPVPLKDILIEFSRVNPLRDITAQNGIDSYTALSAAR